MNMKIKKLETKPKPVLRERWTILDVDEKAIKLVLKYADKTNQKTGAALSEIIVEALSK